MRTRRSERHAGGALSPSRVASDDNAHSAKSEGEGKSPESDPSVGLVMTLGKERKLKEARAVELKKLQKPTADARDAIIKVLARENVQSLDLGNGTFLRLFTNQTTTSALSSWGASDALLAFARRPANERTRVAASTNIDDKLARAHEKKTKKKPSRMSRARASKRKRVKTAIQSVIGDGSV